jgi:adenylate cyclase
LEISDAFGRSQADPTSRRHGFTIGIGIAHGTAIAGQIGTPTQAKVGVFGPVVNQSARLERLTRQLGVSIAVDLATAEWARRLMPREEGRVRRLARVRPKGMETAIDVHELREGADRENEQLTDQMIADYEGALQAIIEGQWDTGRTLLKSLPRTDGPTRFLLRCTAQTQNVPPPEWDGIFTLDYK